MIRSILRKNDPSQLEKLWKIHVESANAIVAQLEGKLVKATKPKLGDPSILFYDIPDSEHLAVRRWDAFVEEDAANCFDLYDTSREIAVNLPVEFKFLQRWCLPSCGELKEKIHLASSIPARMRRASIRSTNSMIRAGSVDRWIRE